MKLLLLGGNGQVGTELRRSLQPLGEVVVATRDGTRTDGRGCETANFDAPDALRTLIERVAPDVVVNAAAYTAVDRAETESADAYRINAEAPAVIAAACATRNALLVHYSTDYVFDGRGSRPYRPDDPTSPLGVYGASKLAGEQAIQDSGARHLILRTAWVYADHGKNFLLTMLRLAAERDELRVVGDQVGSPTSAALIADTTASLLAGVDRPTGVHHLTASGQTSWHGFAEAIIARAVVIGRLPRAPRVTAISTSDYPTPAHRPAYSVLDCGTLQACLSAPLPSWESTLHRCLSA